jgi:integrating conjugative element protein (TIGR03765 family)
MLSIGKVRGRKIRNRMPRAICVVGGDKRSSIWIKKNRSKLESINALCIVVNVSSKSRFRSIKSLAPNVDFRALNGDVFYKELKIKHYPFLLNKGFIHQ